MRPQRVDVPPDRPGGPLPKFINGWAPRWRMQGPDCSCGCPARWHFGQEYESKAVAFCLGCPCRRYRGVDDGD